jgi:hypothetical protein
MHGAHSSWSSILQWVVWFLLMSVVLGWLARARARPVEQEADAWIVRYPPATLWFGAICIGFFSIAGVALFVAGRAALFDSLGIGAMSILGLPFVVDYYVTRFEVRPDGLTFRTTFAGGGETAWTDIVEVRYRPSFKWFSLRLQGGRTVRASVMLAGLPILAKHLLASAVNASIGPEDQAILERTAAGNPPSVWM